MGGVDGLDGVLSVTVSPDGKHVYAVSSLDDSTAVFSRNSSTGALTFLEVHKDSIGGVDGLDGARSVTVSPDGKHLYAAGTSDDAVAVFSRDSMTGALTFVEVHKDGVGDVDGLGEALSVMVSPDGKHLYAAGFSDDAVVVFSRNSTTGSLTFVDVYKDGVDGFEGLDGASSVAISPDGQHLYATGPHDDTVVVFSRNLTTGALTFVEVHKDGVGGVDGLDGARSATVSRDGNHLYVAGLFDNAVAVFSRDSTTGALTFLEVHKDGVAGADGLFGAFSVTVSPDGNRLYTSGQHDNAVVAFSRNTTTGLLTFVENHMDSVGGIDGLDGASSVAVSPDGMNLYSAGPFDDAVAVFRVAPPPPWIPDRTFIVNSTTDKGDTKPGDGSCADNSGFCTLRAAISEANALGSTDTILFDIPGEGRHTIEPTEALPSIRDPVVIDGYSQPGASPNTNGPEMGLNTVLMIEIDGSISGSYSGLLIDAGDTVFRGLVINGFSTGIVVMGSNNVIEGNFIGTGITGTFTKPNSFGISMGTNSTNNLVGGITSASRNVISGNIAEGVAVSGVGNRVIGNIIGADLSGMRPLGNGQSGVLLSQATDAVIGGATPAHRNVISGNERAGVNFQRGATGNRIEGNYIGVDVTGRSPLPNSMGVFVANSPDNVIGGIAPGTGNTIAFHETSSGRGVALSDATGISILGNSMFGNTGLGIDIGLRSRSNDPGDTDSGPNNGQNYPRLELAKIEPDGLLVIGYSVDSLPENASYPLRVEFFKAEDDNERCLVVPSEGEIFLGVDEYLTEHASGHKSVELGGAGELRVVAGDHVLATATDSAGNTSEFSLCLELVDSVEGASSPRFADLAVSITDDIDPVTQNATLLTYNITVLNNGPDDASNVNVFASLPATVRFVSASEECRGAGCQLDTLAVDEQFELTITVRVLPTESGAITTTVVVGADQPDLEGGITRRVKLPGSPYRRLCFPWTQRTTHWIETRVTACVRTTPEIARSGPRS